MSEGMAIGIGLGTAIGIVFGLENIAMFISIGMMLGMVAGINIKKRLIYNTSMTISGFRSTSEQLLENYLESRDDVDWYYKNGDTGQQYLSVIYGNNLSGEYLFYPDYIIKKKNGDVWIIEAKGGERKGVSKNIDKQIENKFYAFKDYADRRKINGGFVRDKDTRLYINNTDYTE